MLIAKYSANGKTFEVTEEDRVVILNSHKKEVVVGFSHSRAWTAMREEARKITRP